jgi:DNA-directed RNA polymerase subunit H (RpoH/RPB5)
MAGYAETPLLRKLGIKPGYVIRVIDEPADYFKWISPLPEDVVVSQSRSGFDFIHWFLKEHMILEKEFLKVKKLLKKEGMLWISWPKKASGVVTDLNENIIREIGLKNGLVDVKVCAVDEVWSGLKFVYRLSDR